MDYLPPCHIFVLTTYRINSLGDITGKFHGSTNQRELFFFFMESFKFSHLWFSKSPSLLTRSLRYGRVDRCPIVPPIVCQFRSINPRMYFRNLVESIGTTFKRSEHVGITRILKGEGFPNGGIVTCNHSPSATWWIFFVVIFPVNLTMTSSVVIIVVDISPTTKCTQQSLS